MLKKVFVHVSHDMMLSEHPCSNHTMVLTKWWNMPRHTSFSTSKVVLKLPLSIFSSLPTSMWQQRCHSYHHTLLLQFLFLHSLPTAAAPRVTCSGCHVHWPDWLNPIAHLFPGGDWCSGVPVTSSYEVRQGAMSQPCGVRDSLWTRLSLSYSLLLHAGLACYSELSTDID